MSRDFKYKTCSCYVSKEEERVYILLSLLSETPCCGHGASLILAIKKWAKRHNYTIRLFVAPFAHRTLNEKSLFRWYSERGFIYIGPPQGRSIWMEYRPRGWLN